MCASMSSHSLCMVEFMVVCMVAIHAYAAPDLKALSLVALVFMIIMAGITSSVHFTVLTVSRPLAAAGLAGASWFFSFSWLFRIFSRLFKGVEYSIYIFDRLVEGRGAILWTLLILTLIISLLVSFEIGE